MSNLSVRQVPRRYGSVHPSISSEPNPARQVYLAMLASVDEGVGRLVETLKETGEYDNTIIAFTSAFPGPMQHGAGCSLPVHQTACAA